MAFKLRKPPPLSSKHDAYPYQLDAVRAVQSLPYAAIFHEQGLGKTKIATDLILLWLAEDVVDTVFVVTKKTLVQNWVDELFTHSHITPRVLSGNRRENSIALNSPVLIYIMNYEVISANLDLLQMFLCTCRVAAILDESQKIKNPDAGLTVDFHTIANSFVRRIIMTGTPVANRPYDMWSQIRFLDEGAALGPSFSQFKESLDLPSEHPDQDYGLRLSNVMTRIKHFTVRETKQSSGLVLPDKTILTHEVDMATRQSAIYANYRNEMAHDVEVNGNLIIDNAEVVLKRLLRLVQCASNPVLVDESYDELPGKYLVLIDLLNDIDLLSNKVIIWTGFITNVVWLETKLAQYQPQKVHGSMTVADRNESIRKFKTDTQCRVLIATPGAAKEGLTLTVANHAIFYDRGFSLDDYLQAQDRIHRISQTEDCSVHNLIATNTIDEWVDTLLNAKHQAARLTQGDISQTDFDLAFTHDLSSELKQILAPDQNHKINNL